MSPHKNIENKDKWLIILERLIYISRACLFTLKKMITTHYINSKLQSDNKHTFLLTTGMKYNNYFPFQVNLDFTQIRDFEKASFGLYNK